jgi:hypothetical protein
MEEFLKEFGLTPDQLTPEELSALEQAVQSNDIQKAQSILQPVFARLQEESLNNASPEELNKSLGFDEGQQEQAPEQTPEQKQEQLPPGMVARQEDGMNILEPQPEQAAPAGQGQDPLAALLGGGQPPAGGEQPLSEEAPSNVSYADAVEKEAKEDPNYMDNETTGKKEGDMAEKGDMTEEGQKEEELEELTPEEVANILDGNPDNDSEIDPDLLKDVVSGGQDDVIDEAKLEEVKQSAKDILDKITAEQEG